jgi:HSP20 family protein
MLSLWNNPFLPERTQSDSRMSTKSLFDRIFEDTWGATIQDLYRIPAGIGIESKKGEDGSLDVSIDVPGIQESDLIIEVIDGIITVKGERKTSISTHSIQKSFSIPEGYDTENVSAELKNGILSLKLAAKQLPSKEIKRIALTSGK